MASVTELIRFLDRRRRQLGMSRSVLAERSGISLPTVHRILAGDRHSPRLSSVLALASALGVRLGCDEESTADELRQKQAWLKAKRLVGMVQGSAALEGQGLDEETRERMVQQTVHELLAGSRRRIWAA
jgi:transcriptional regulator with XRE-family HTH domain